ncbi:hypothetical protein VUR80DRAFT_9154 [Thermomyces stellatus]
MKPAFIITSLAASIAMAAPSELEARTGDWTGCLLRCARLCPKALPLFAPCYAACEATCGGVAEPGEPLTIDDLAGSE